MDEEHRDVALTLVNTILSSPFEEVNGLQGEVVVAVDEALLNDVT